MLPNPHFHSVMVIAFACDVKSFAIAFLVFFLLLLVSVLNGFAKSFYVCFRDCYPGCAWPRSHLLLLHVRQKAFQLSFLFFYFSSAFLNGVENVFYYVSHIVTLDAYDQYRPSFVGHTGKWLREKCSVNLKFLVCQNLRK